ncbi:MAG: amino acid decarboxylase [Ruminococcaceae bacterium]|nr:amino acid decarboxylase [Oscillospiraceae bacterium]
MTTPIVDFVRRYAEKKGVRFHMPGHKGKPYLGCEHLDITEIKGADVLYDAAGIIDESEQNATALFGSAHTFYSTEGATLAIKAMLATVAMQLPRGERLHVLAARNAHKAFLYGAALLDAKVTWLYPKDTAHLCACPLSREEVANAIRSCAEKPHAVYLTSPDYLGNVADIAAIAAVCDGFGVPLLVDNAHGAYLNFLSPSRHPIALGATMCADSAHKTLSVLTGGAYLHVARKAPEAYLKSAREALSLFASTSPSYLILQSLDLCNAVLADGYAAALAETAARVAGVRAVLLAHGYRVLEGEPLKIVIEAAKSGYTGEALADILRENGIEPEFADKEFLVLMCTEGNGEADLLHLCTVLCSVPLRAALPQTQPPIIRPTTGLSIREAMLSPAELVSLENAAGRICAAPTVSCPPAVPIAVAGEYIDESVIALLRHYGVDRIKVIKE